MIDLNKILELESKATPKTWDVESWQYGQINFEDAELIYVMRNNIKELCTELKAAREAIRAAKRYTSAEFAGAEYDDWGQLKNALRKYEETTQLKSEPS